MMTSKELDGTLQRTVILTIKPTPTEIADAIWNLDASEQIVLLGCLNRRFCKTEEGIMQMASIANELDTVSTEKSDEVKSFVRCLEDYVLGENAELQLTKAKDLIRNLLPFEHVIDPYAFTSDIEENKRRFHEPFRKAEQFLKEVENA